MVKDYYRGPISWRCILKADCGEILVFDEKVHFGNTKTNRFIGYLPDVPEFYDYMTSKEYLNLCGEITGLSKSEIKERTEEMLRSESTRLNSSHMRISYAVFCLKKKK